MEVRTADLAHVAAGLLGLGAAAVVAGAGAQPGLAVLVWAGLHVAALARERWLPAVLALDLLLVGWQAASLAPLGFDLRADTWVHLALIRRVADHGLFPPDAFFKEHGAAPLLSLVHHFYALAALLTGRTGDVLWRWGAPLSLVGLAGAVYFAHLQLFRSRGVALLAALVQLSWRGYIWPFAGYPRNVAHALHFVTLGLLFRALRDGRRGASLGAGAALGACIACHAYSGLMALVVVAALLAVESAVQWRRGRLRRVLEVAAWLSLGALVTGGPAVAYHAGSAPAEDRPALSERLSRIGGEASPRRLRVLSKRLRLDLERKAWPPGHQVRRKRAPDPGVRRLLLWALPCLLGAVALLLPGTDRLVRVYGVAATLVGVAALASPASRIAVGLVSPYYVMRFVNVLPVAALAALGLSLLLPRRPSVAGVPGALALTGLLALLHPHIEPWRWPQDRPPSAPLQRDDLTRLSPRIAGRVVLADPDTAYVLPHFTGAFVASGKERHLNPWARDDARARGAKAILGGRAEGSEIRRYCERYGVDFALLPATSATSRVRQQLVGSGLFREDVVGEDQVLLKTRR